MKRLIILLVFMLSLQTCKKTEWTENHTRYFEIWKSILQERNQFDNEYFHKHIQLKKMEFWQESAGSGNHYCKVYYSLNIDYVTIELMDQFIIWKSSKDPLFPDFVVPKDVWLGKKDIAYLINAQSNYSEVNWMVPTEKLWFKSKYDVIKTVDAKVRNAKFNGYSLKGKTNYPLNQRGHVFMEMWKEVSRKNNECTHVQIDLINGEIEIQQTVCWFE